jgi:hypothetical protein
LRLVDRDVSYRVHRKNKEQTLLKTVLTGISLAFVFSGHSLVSGQESVADTHSAPGERTPIQLTLMEREFVLAEMGLFLESVQIIVNGIADGNMALVAEYARKSGRAAQAGMPASLPEKLPASFKQLGSDTHRKFDELALDAEQLGDGEHSLSQLGHLLDNCVSCHSTFRIEWQ